MNLEDAVVLAQTRLDFFANKGLLSECVAYDQSKLKELLISTYALDWLEINNILTVPNFKEFVLLQLNTALLVASNSGLQSCCDVNYREYQYDFSEIIANETEYWLEVLPALSVSIAGCEKFFLDINLQLFGFLGDLVASGYAGNLLYKNNPAMKVAIQELIRWCSREQAKYSTLANKFKLC